MTNSDLIVASSFPFLPDNLLGSSSFGKSTSCLSCWKNSTTLEEGSADFGLIPVTRRCIVTAAALLAARPLCRHHGNITGIGLWSTGSDMAAPENFILPSYAINTYYLLATVHGGAVVTRSDFQREPSSSHFYRTISVPLPLHKIQRFTESRKVRLRIVISNP